jgi:hypothetical protein
VSAVPFHPSPDVAAVLGALLDAYERRAARPGGPGPRVIRCDVTELALPGYHSQDDPLPRQVANEQLQALERLGWLRLQWLPEETGHLLAAVALVPQHAPEIFAWLVRAPRAQQRARLRGLLLGERFRFDGWRLRAVDHVLAQLDARHAPAPFNLDDDAFNRDLLAALSALGALDEETPYRVFSVRAFNDSKRFEALARAIVVLARRGEPEWRGRPADEVLRELSLVANPSFIYLYGAWRLVDSEGHTLDLGGFRPAGGLAAAQAGRLREVRADGRVMCVENATSFYELARQAPDGIAALCLWGNPSPACRHLLRRLCAGRPADTPLYVWTDVDYGGLNILAQLREQVGAQAIPVLMDAATVEAHVAWARPLTAGDRQRLARMAARSSLSDQAPLIDYLLRRGVKLEQEAIRLQALAEWLGQT